MQTNWIIRAMPLGTRLDHNKAAEILSQYTGVNVATCRMLVNKSINELLRLYPQLDSEMMVIREKLQGDRLGFLANDLWDIAHCLTIDIC